MNFDKVFNTANIDECSKKLTTVFVDLALKTDNYGCGSHHGGNNFQMITFMNINHSLVNSDNIQWNPHHKSLQWGEEYLLKASIKEIRERLDVVFKDIDENHKLWSVALDFYNGVSYKTVIEKYRENFPRLNYCLRGGPYKVDPELSRLEQYLLACIMCEEIASILDGLDPKLNTNKIQYSEKTRNYALQEGWDKTRALFESFKAFPPELYLLCVRKHINISRIVRWRLEESHAKYMFVAVNDILG